MIPFDLHMHSAHSSDGEFSPWELVAKCADKGLTRFSLTDHNSVKGTAEAAQAAHVRGLGFTPGIEIDCNYCATDLHLLGYGIDWHSADFESLELAVRQQVLASFAQMIDNIVRQGFVVDGAAVLAAAGEGLPTAELIAEVMLADPDCHTPSLLPYLPGGARSDMPQINFYLDWFAQGRPAHVPIEYIGFGQAVELVRDNGGVPVVAHPGLNFKGRERLVEKLLASGAAGLEVFNNYHSAEQVAYFAPLVAGRKSLMTCGSDFHGKTKPLIGVGEFRLDARYAACLLDAVNYIDMVPGQGV